MKALDLKASIADTVAERARAKAEAMSSAADTTGSSAKLTSASASPTTSTKEEVRTWEAAAQLYSAAEAVWLAAVRASTQGQAHVLMLENCRALSAVWALWCTAKSASPTARKARAKARGYSVPSGGGGGGSGSELFSAWNAAAHASKEEHEQWCKAVVAFEAGVAKAPKVLIYNWVHGLATAEQYKLESEVLMLYCEAKKAELEFAAGSKGSRAEELRAAVDQKYYGANLLLSQVSIEFGGDNASLMEEIQNKCSK